MNSGINEEKVNELKIELLDYIEKINAILSRFDNSIEAVKNNIEDNGKDEILRKLNSIKEQFPNISSNISHYIDDLGKAASSYETQDQEIASTLINNVTRLGEGRE